jgi:hypothetical protein
MSYRTLKPYSFDARKAIGLPRCKTSNGLTSAHRAGHFNTHHKNASHANRTPLDFGIGALLQFRSVRVPTTSDKIGTRFGDTIV